MSESLVNHQSVLCFRVQVAKVKVKVVYKIISNHFQTGVTGLAAWNEIRGFSPIKNVGPDAFHDLAEGVHHAEFSLALEHFIEKKFITLDLFNRRLKTFDFGPCAANKHDVILRSHIDKQKFAWTGAEMLLMMTIFPILLGDLIPEDDDYWKLLILLKQVTDKALQFKFAEGEVEELDRLVIEHHTYFVQELGQHLKPKHHHMLHYKEAILMHGPLVNTWSIRLITLTRIISLTLNS